MAVASAQGLRPQYQVVLAMLGARALNRPVRLCSPASKWTRLCYRRDHRALGPLGQGYWTLDCMIARGHRGDVAVRGGLAPRHGWVWAALQVPPTLNVLSQAGASRRPHLGRYAGLRWSLPASMHSRPLWTISPLHSDRPLELRLKCYSYRAHNEDLPYTSKRSANATKHGAAASAGTSAPSDAAMRDCLRSSSVGGNLPAGSWEASQIPAAVRIPA